MLSPREFWNLFSRRQFALAVPEELPEALGYAALFDQLFGRLANHGVAELSVSGAEILCTDCDRAGGRGDDVCETHIGILEGQMNRRFGASYEGTRTTSGGTCRLSFRHRGPETSA